jgi:dethiobiotin synthetase/adenosylmethionine--8-amino-7-oxononanoate aminotransferase
MCDGPCGSLLLQWDETAAAQVSEHPRVKGVVVLGSVLAVELADTPAAGTGSSSGAGSYGSSAAVGVVGELRRRGVYARPLGPVVYLMVTPTSTRESSDWLLSQLREVLDVSDVWEREPGGDGVLI